ncbi:MAG: preprotein translocase subunit SecG [Alphaproteobacteria bacterium]|nr:preprotein translocase subunit SecG [Alphaproteobacteria bacterium]
MQAVLLLIHLFLAIALVITVLLQRSEGGALGIGGSSMGGLMTTRGTANLLTRATGIIATCFILTSLTLAILAGNTRERRSIVDQPVQTAPAEPAQPAAPSAPLAK